MNVSADGTTVSWDEVENATSYAVLADGSEIGTVEGAATEGLAGTWVFNDTIDVISASVSVNFIDLNQKQFNGIAPSGATMYYGFLDDSGRQDGLMAYGGSGWNNDAYKTIAITSKLSEVTNGDTLLAWLQANATKQ